MSNNHNKFLIIKEKKAKETIRLNLRMEANRANMMIEEKEEVIKRKREAYHRKNALIIMHWQIR